MNEEFLNKVVDQIISETRVIDNKIYTPFYPSPPLFLFPSSLSVPPPPFFSRLLCPFSFHCKEVYCLNKEETGYVWGKYKEGITAIIEDKEPAHQEKRMMIHNSENNNIYGEYTNE